MGILLKTLAVLGAGLINYFFIANWIDYLIFRLAVKAAGYSVEDLTRLPSWSGVGSTSVGVSIVLVILRPVVSTLIIFGSGAVLIGWLGLKSWAAFGAFAYFFLLTQHCCLVGRKYSLNVAGWAMVITMVITVVGYGLVTSKPSESEYRFDETMKGFHDTDLPRNYGLLLSHIRARGSLTVDWVSQSGETQSLEARLDSQGSLILETSIPMFNPDDPSGCTEIVAVTMTDIDVDGDLDQVLCIYGDGMTEKPDVAQNEGLETFWKQCLTIMFALGEPFREGGQGE